MRLAHFSDFHLGHPGIKQQARRLRGLIDHALARGAEHLLFGGDLVDHANLEDLEVLVAHLEKRGCFTSGRCTVIPGNHDIWPFGEVDLHAQLAPFLVDHARALLTGADWPAQQTYRRFLRTFAPTFQGVTPMGASDPLPCTKRVGPWLLGLLDTTSDRGLYPAQGRFVPAEGRWLRDRLAEHRGPKLVLLHHWPFAWEAANAAEVSERVLEHLPGIGRRALRLALAAAGVTLPGLVSRFADVNYRALAQVERFIAGSGADAVLCGHLHLAGEDPRDAGFDAAIGGVPVHCMGRSGAVHQDAGRDDLLAYHLVEPRRGGAAVETVYVRAGSLLRAG